MKKIILAGDIGGTNTRLLLANINNQNAKQPKLVEISKAKYKNKDFPKFEDIIKDFINQNNSIPIDNIQAACFAVAGPIINQKVKLTNLPWSISAKRLKKNINLNNILLINDFTAIGYGIPNLEPEDYVVLQGAPKQTKSPIAYLGAGTGLGVGLMMPTNNENKTNKISYEIMHTEGGHVDFAPTNTLQINILQYLYKKYHRVSAERLLSGEGLFNIYQYLQSSPPYGIKEDPNLKHETETGDPAKAISVYATEKKDILSQIALDEFCKIYGSVTGNIALATLCYGGLYIAGGIAPQIIEVIKTGNFMRKFKDKGRMSSLLENIPLSVIIDPDIGLKGACWAANEVS